MWQRTVFIALAVAYFNLVPKDNAIVISDKSQAIAIKLKNERSAPIIIVIVVNTHKSQSNVCDSLCMGLSTRATEMTVLCAVYECDLLQS